MRKKDLVPPLVLLLPCQSVVIADSETGAPTWFQDQGPRWVGSREPAIATETLGTQWHDHVPNAPQWSQHLSGDAVSELCKKCKDEVSGKGSEVSQDTTWAVALAGRLPLSRGNERRTEGLLTRRLTSLAAHKRVTGKFLLDVFGGPGFLSKASIRPELRGNVLRHEVWTQV